MTENIALLRFLPYVTYIVALVGAVTSGVLVYSGLATKLERRHLRLRLKEGWDDSKRNFVDQAKSSPLEQLLIMARYPLGLNALRVNILYIGLLLLVIMNYGLTPLLLIGEVKGWPILISVITVIILYPGLPFSPVRMLLNQLIEYRKAKRNAELFSLYDMLVSEIEMMRNTRINVYSLIRTLLPYFVEIKPQLTKMLSEWSSSSVGPYEAINGFAESINTSEAKSLATVLKTFDENSRDTLLTSLRGMEDIFITSQIENSRRKRKMFVDVLSIPVKSANFLIMLNFVFVIVVMTMKMMEGTSLPFK